MRFSTFLVAAILPLPLLGAPQPSERAILDPIFDLIKIVPIVGDLLSPKILDEILDYFDLHLDIRLAFPGLRDVLAKVKANDLDSDAFARGLLKAIKAHSTFQGAFNDLDVDLQKNVTAFMEGASAASIVGRRDFVVPASPAAKRHFKAMEDAGSTEVSRRWLNWKRQVTPVVYEDEEKTKVMVSYVAAEFNNWGLTVSNTPALTFVPTTIHGLENLVAYAKANNKRVRAAGYRHTWTPLFSEDNEIFVSMLDLKTANAVPDPSSILPDDPSTASNEFKVIQLADSDVAGQEGKKRVARIGAAVTNEELRRWSIRSGWTLPLNVIMVEITLGGSNAPICHGGGIRHKTLSDLVRKIEYIDANGVHQSVDDPAWLKAAAGSFGLLGVITHVTIELDKMSYAVMKPLKQDIGLAIPPPEGFEVPDAIKNTYTDADLEAARKAFVQKSEESYYSEFFWFPYQPQAFVNCWDNTDDDAEVAEYPSYPDTFSQWIQGWLGGVINDDPLWRALPGHWQSVILSSLAMLALPPQLGAINTEIHTHLINALHFRRGVQNMRVRDMELQIPIPPLASDSTKPDWSVVQRAWWDAIAVVYADARAPMRIALEMRIMGASDMIMAPQTGNAFGTASIEVLTTMPAVADGAWAGFVQEVADRWMAYEYEGEKINTRPHWAKEWDGMTVRGQPWREYLREVSYKDEIPRFKAVLAEIGAEQGWALEDLQRRFSNPLLDEIFFA